MIDDYDDDTHFCLKCHATIIGLETYIEHRKSKCCKRVVETNPKEIRSILTKEDSFALKADDFFSSLELQSSSKKPTHQTPEAKPISGIWTRSKTSAINQANAHTSKETEPSKSGKNAWIGGHQLKELGSGDNQSKLIKAVDNLSRNTTIKKIEPTNIGVYDESDEDFDEYDSEEDEFDEDDNAPPRSHTGGKWKPTSPLEWSQPSTLSDRDWIAPPPNFTGGKWKPSKRGPASPPPTHTKGKWKPLSPSSSKDSSAEIPPPTFTGSKWTPTKSIRNVYQDVPPPSHTKGKWKPADDALISKEGTSSGPPISYTKGKWKPEKEIPSKSDVAPFRKSSGTVQYWCGPCNRRLASKIVYERHLRSGLHQKRTLKESEFEETSVNQSKFDKNKSEEWKGESMDDDHQQEGQPKRKTRKKTYVKCPVCRSRVHIILMGKHLISHYHCRRGDINQPEAQKLVLKNIHSIVHQSPFQCAICRFYCNTHEIFLKHWASSSHIEASSKYSGYYSCTFCKFTGNSEEIDRHLISHEHQEVISAFNGSVPIVIRKIRPVQCETCKIQFTLNIQLRKHCERSGHKQSVTSCDKYQEKHTCSKCKSLFKSRIALARHKRSIHRIKEYICFTCNETFSTISEAKQHRRSMKHRYAVQERQRKEGIIEKINKKCRYCKTEFDNVPDFKKHLQTMHPEQGHKCPLCGETFTMPQEVTAHVRTKSCSFKDKSSKTCDLCPFSSDSTSEMLYHKVLHGEPILIYPKEKEGQPSTSNRRPFYHFKCPICQKLFEKSSLKCHIRLHTKERPFVCDICNASFVRKNNLHFHQKNHENPEAVVAKKPITKPTDETRSFLCSVCGDSFLKRSILQQHMMIHTGKVFKCVEENCIFTCRNKGELKIHLTTHSDERPFSCTECDYRAKCKFQLKRHAQIHNKDRKKLQCTKCSFTSTNPSHVKRHMRLHEGGKPYMCPHCSYMCNDMEYLRKHVLSTNRHPGKKIYGCKFCPKGEFATNLAKEFQVHLVKNHTEMFSSAKEAGTYISGMFYPEENVVPFHTEYIKQEIEPSSVVKIEYITASTDKSKKDKILPEPPKETILETSSDTWTMVESYDVEESTVLVPFQHDGEPLFQESFIN